MFCLAFMLIQITAPIERPPIDLERSVWAHSFCLSPEGAKLALVGYLREGNWAVWGVADKKLCASGRMKVVGAHAVVFSKNGKELVVGGDALIDAGVLRAELRILDVESGRELAALDGHRASVTQLAVLPGGKHLVSRADDNTIRIWSLAERKPVAKYCFTSKADFPNAWQRFKDAEHEKPPLVVVHADPIQRLYEFAIHKDGQLMAIATGTDKVFFVETLTGKITRRLHCKRVTVSVSLAFSPDGQWLAIGGAHDNGCIEIWDVAKNRLVRVLEKHVHSVLCVAFSPDNELLVSGGLVDGARVWNLKTGAEKYRLHVRDDKESSIRAVGFLPDGSTLLTLCGGEPLRFWDAATGGPVHRKMP